MLQSVGWHTTGVRYNLVTKQQQTLVKLLSRLEGEEKVPIVPRSTALSGRQRMRVRVEGEELG